MSKIIQYRPAYFTGFENAEVSFETVDELLTIPFVANFSNIENFHCYSLWIGAADAKYSIPENVRLMAEYDAGKKWWVVGRIEGELPKLPTWKVMD